MSSIQFQPFLHSPFSPFAPVIEPADTVDAFITTHPYESVKNGAALDIPWLNSLTTHEGIYPAGSNMKHYIKKIYIHCINPIILFSFRTRSEIHGRIEF